VAYSGQRARGLRRQLGATQTLLVRRVDTAEVNQQGGLPENQRAPRPDVAVEAEEVGRVIAALPTSGWRPLVTGRSPRRASRLHRKLGERGRTRANSSGSQQPVAYGRHHARLVAAYTRDTALSAQGNAHLGESKDGAEGRPAQLATSRTCPPGPDTDVGAHPQNEDPGELATSTPRRNHLQCDPSPTRSRDAASSAPGSLTFHAGVDRR